MGIKDDKNLDRKRESCMYLTKVMAPVSIGTIDDEYFEYKLFSVEYCPPVAFL